MSDDPPRFADLAEGAAHLGISENYLRRLALTGRVRHLRIGRALRFERSDLDALLAASVREPVAR